MTTSPASPACVKPSRKPRPRPIRRCRLSGPAVGVRVLTVTVTTPLASGEEFRVEVDRFFLSAAPSDFGRAFRLERFPDQVKPGEATHYETCLHGQQSLCSCPGFERFGMSCNDGTGCKHIGALVALVADGRL